MEKAPFSSLDTTEHDPSSITVTHSDPISNPLESWLGYGMTSTNFLRCCWLALLAWTPPAQPFASRPPPLIRTADAPYVISKLARTRTTVAPGALPPRKLGRLRSLPPVLETLVADALDADRKIIVVTGGVLSGIGKGVTASSMGVVSANSLFVVPCTCRRPPPPAAQRSVAYQRHAIERTAFPGHGLSSHRPEDRSVSERGRRNHGERRFHETTLLPDVSLTNNNNGNCGSPLSSTEKCSSSTTEGRRTWISGTTNVS